MRSLFFYFSIFTFIFLYWHFNFTPKYHSTPHKQSVILNTEVQSIKLSQFNRKDLIEALSGNLPLMIRLITDWEIDAQQLKEKKIEDIQSLPKEKYFQALKLSRQVTKKSSKKRYLPQTYTAASILLALIEPENIIAIPPNLRDHIELYSEESLKAIPLNCDRKHSESLFQASPDLAFIASYSQPQMISTLKTQGIPLCHLKTALSFDDISDSIRLIGEKTHSQEKAQVLNTFLQSARLNMINRLKAQRQKFSRHSPCKVLLLQYFQHWHSPHIHSILGQTIDELGAYQEIRELKTKSSSQWNIPLSQEDFALLSPHCMINSSQNAHPPFNSKAFIQNVDAYVQGDLSQYFLIAYYDLYTAISNAELYDSITSH